MSHLFGSRFGTYLPAHLPTCLPNLAMFSINIHLHVVRQARQARQAAQASRYSLHLLGILGFLAMPQEKASGLPQLPGRVPRRARPSRVAVQGVEVGRLSACAPPARHPRAYCKVPKPETLEHCSFQDPGSVFQPIHVPSFLCLSNPPPLFSAMQIIPSQQDPVKLDDYVSCLPAS